MIHNYELSLIKLLLTKELYNKYIGLIDLNYIKEYHRELYYLYVVLNKLHEEHNEDITVDEFSVSFYVRYPDADKNVYGNLFKQLKELEISSEVGMSILLQIKTRKAALKVSEIAFKVAQGIESFGTLKQFVDAETNEVDHQQELPLTLVTDDLDQLLSSAYQDRGFRWRLECLNKSLGSLRPGDFGFIFARPETGKTTFLASECSNFLLQTQKPVVWFNNEEQGSKVMLRIYQAYFGVTLDKLLSNPRRYKEQFLAETSSRLKLFDSALISKQDVEAIIKDLNPGVVIYDQIDKLRGFTNDRDDLRLGAIYQWARELAKGNHAGIGVCQADGTAEGVRYLTMEHVANAKTAKQAEADWILGIGKTHAEGAEYVRYLNISKNKLLGDNDSISDLRHGRFETLIKPDIARYEDVIQYG